MATPSGISIFIGLTALLLAFIPQIRFGPRERNVTQQCLNRPFEELYTCHLSPHDHIPGQSPGTWGPWGWGPLCFIPEQSSASYCLVSSASYNSNRGVSIIARQDFIPQLQQAMLDDNAALAASPHLGPARDEDYEHKEIPGKGIGVVARRGIARGAPLMVSLPGIIFDNEFRDLLEADTNAQELYRRATDQLADRERVLGLSRSVGGEPLEDVLRTNAHTARVAGRNLALVYPEVARINHACNPNALVRFVPNKLTMEVIAVRNIAAGEEITIIYIQDGLESSDRKSSLAAFNFECQCQLCAASRDAISASDQNRRRIQEIWGSLDRIRGEPATVDPGNVQLLSSEMLALAREESLGPSTMKRYDHDLMRIFFEQGDIRSAIGYAKESLLLSEEFDGPEDADGLQRALRMNMDALREYLPSLVVDCDRICYRDIGQRALSRLSANRIHEKMLWSLLDAF